MRVFVYEGREFPDPSPEMTVEQVRDRMADFLPELVNASWDETARGDDTVYEFRKRVGTKGELRREPHTIRGWIDEAKRLLAIADDHRDRGDVQAYYAAVTAAAEALANADAIIQDTKRGQRAT